MKKLGSILLAGYLIWIGYLTWDARVSKVSAQTAATAVSTGTPKALNLPDGSTCTTQSALDNSTKCATTAYVDTAVSNNNVPTAGWSIVNSAILSDFTGSSFSMTITNNASLNWRLITRTLPSTPYTIIAAMDGIMAMNANSSTYGLYLYDGTKLEGIEVLSQTTGAAMLRVEKMNSVTSDNFTLAGATSGLVGWSSVFKITDNGTLRTFYYWSNGAFVQFFQENTNTFLTPDRIGVGGIAANAGGILTQIRLYYWVVS